MHPFRWGGGPTEGLIITPTPFRAVLARKPCNGQTRTSGYLSEKSPSIATFLKVHSRGRFKALSRIGSGKKHQGASMRKRYKPVLKLRAPGVNPALFSPPKPKDGHLLRQLLLLYVESPTKGQTRGLILHQATKTRI